GLDIPEFAEVLTDFRYSKRIAESTDHAHSIGARGVPAWLIDDRILIVGAQPHDAFHKVLTELGYSVSAA
ncbi:MAG: DsbA family oxidoreductase, partial [Actinomycetota bacterium]